jgi:hypothetical protein
MFDMVECNHVATLMEQKFKLTSKEGNEFEDATKYRQLVGSLIYLTTTRPNISFVVGILSEISLIRLIKIFATVLMLWRADLIHWGFLDAF